MPSMPVLSIIIPVYNVAPYLDECLDSLVQQDVPRPSYEIICVDDGSTDGSSNILDRFALDHSNVIVIHQSNGGVSSARNTGLDRANGRYVWFVDGDDFIACCCLANLIPVLEETTPDVLFIRPIAFEDGIDTNRFHVPNVPADMTSEMYDKWLWTRLYRRQIINDSNVRFCEGLAFAEDNLFCALLRPFVKKEVKNDCVAYFYRKRRSSVSGTPTKEKLEILIHACTVFMDCSKTKRISQSDAAFIVCPTMSSVMFAVASMPRQEAKYWLRRIRMNGLFPLNKQYRNRREYDAEGLTSENRVLQKLKGRSYTISGYCVLRIFRIYLRIKRRLRIECARQHGSA